MLQQVQFTLNVFSSSFPSNNFCDIFILWEICLFQFNLLICQTRFLQNTVPDLYLWSQLVNTNAHMLLWLFGFSGWGVWQSRAPGGERRITGIQCCSHGRNGSLPVTLWLHQQPVNINKLSIPGNVSSGAACCCVPYSTALSSWGKDWIKWCCIFEGFEVVQNANWA